VQSERTGHSAEVAVRELRQRLAVAEQSHEELRELLEQKEAECRALEQNMRELMENLRNAAIEAGRAAHGGREATGD
jgi:hypothetical protein